MLRMQYYYADAYPQSSRSSPHYNLSCCTEKKLLAAWQGLIDDGVALQYLQLDDVRAPRLLAAAHSAQTRGSCRADMLLVTAGGDNGSGGTLVRTRPKTSEASSVYRSGSCPPTHTPVDSKA
eukprot:COSAG01_NODE_3530_length_5964_cov_653.329241_5_plen_122_part_00